MQVLGLRGPKERLRGLLQELNEPELLRRTSAVDAAAAAGHVLNQQLFFIIFTFTFILILVYSRKDTNHQAVYYL